MYALPAGYWCQVAQINYPDAAEKHPKDKEISLKVYRKPQLSGPFHKWQVFKLQPGWFFYRYKRFALPKGYYICEEPPVFYPKMAEFWRQMRHIDTKVYRLPKPILRRFIETTFDTRPMKFEGTDEVQSDEIQGRVFYSFAFFCQKLMSLFTDAARSMKNTYCFLHSRFYKEEEMKICNYHFHSG